MAQKSLARRGAVALPEFCEKFKGMGLRRQKLIDTADCVLRRSIMGQFSEDLRMIRGFIVGAMLLLGSVSSEAQTTVKDFTMSMSNPDRKGVAELYAIGVGHGFFWYQVMMVARSRAGMGGVEMPLFCLPVTRPSQRKLFWMQRNVSWKRPKGTILSS